MSRSDYKSLSKGYFDNTRSHLSSNNLMENKIVENFVNGRIYNLEQGNTLTKVICSESMGYWRGTVHEKEAVDKCNLANRNWGYDTRCEKSNDCSGYFHVYYPTFKKRLTYKNATSNPILLKNAYIDISPFITPGKTLKEHLIGEIRNNNQKPTKLEFHFLIGADHNRRTKSISNLQINTETGQITGALVDNSIGKSTITVFVSYTDPVNVKIFQTVALDFMKG